MKLRYATFTGADDNTDLSELQRISNEYPFVEWGFLLSQNKKGTQRYPSASTFEKINELHVKKSIHICGSICKSIVENGAISDKNDVSLFMSAMKNPLTTRCQLNFNLENTKLDLLNMSWFALRFFNKFILQQNKSNSPLIDSIYPFVSKTKRLQVLFDCSGGCGTEIEKIPSLIPDIFCGYAGGLSPENLEKKLQEIESVVDGNEIWIDMESGVRTNNEFDLNKVVQCCEIAKNTFNYDNASFR